MGGFALDYVASSEQVIGSFNSDDGDIDCDFYVLDDTRLLCVIWRLLNESGYAWAMVIDHSDPVDVVFGDMTALEYPGEYGSRPSATQLTDTDWLLVSELGNFQRFTVVGNVVTPGDNLFGFEDFAYSTWNGVTGWNHAIWEGHDDTDTSINFGPRHAFTHSHLQCIGLDINHILMPGFLEWVVPSHQIAVRWFVFDLTTSGVQPVSSFVPDSGLAPTPVGAALVDSGLAYWWVSDPWTDDSVLPTNLKLALVEATTSSITVAEVTGVDFEALYGSTFPADSPWPILGRNFDDDTWWISSVVNTELKASWLPTDPWNYTTTMVKIDTVTATTHDYTGEFDWDNSPPNSTRAWWFDTGKMAANVCQLTWQIDDDHLRAEQGRSNTYTHPAPHDGQHKAGLSHGRFVGIETNAVSHVAGDLFGSVLVERALPPEVSFSVDNDTVDVGTPITFDAEDFSGGFDSRNDSRDSYWHPIDEYRWEWDDGTADTFTSSNPTTHTYTAGSETHAAGSQTADVTIVSTRHIGQIGYYLPVLRAHNSVGWSYASGRWEIEVDAPPPAMGGWVVGSIALKH